MRALMTWVLYDRFNQIPKREIIKEKSRLMELVVECWKPGTDVKTLQQEKYAEQIETTKSYTNKHLVMNLSDMDYKFIQTVGYSQVYSMPFQNFKSLFKPDSEDEGIDEVVIKVFDPESMKMDHLTFFNKPYIYESAMADMLRFYLSEINAYKKIESYNKKVRNKSQRLNVPKLLDHGSLVVWRDSGYIFVNGYYIIMSKIQSTREFKRKDIPKLRRQIRLLNEKAYIQHGDIVKRNIIVNNDDVYLIDFDNSGNIHPSSRIRNLESRFCDLTVINSN